MNKTSVTILWRICFEIKAFYDNSEIPNFSALFLSSLLHNLLIFCNSTLICGIDANLHADAANIFERYRRTWRW